MADYPITPNTPQEDLLNLVAKPSSNLIIDNGEWSQMSIDTFHKQVQKGMMGQVDAKTPSLISPFSIDTSSRYPLQVIGMDNEDIYAQGQNGWNKAFNAILKGGSLALTTFLQSTVGLVNGVFQSVSDGKFSSFYDNEFNRTLDGLNKELENQLPNYYSAAERERPWYQNIFTSNFIWDKVVKNLGFMAGAVASANVYARLLQASKLAATGGMANALSETEAAVLSGTTSQTVGQTANAYRGFMGAYNALNTGQKVLVAGLSTVGEAGIEALQGVDEVRKKLIEDYRQVNGQLPTGEELKRIEDAASNVGNTIFALNVGILTASNYIQFPKLMAASNTAERGMFAELTRRATGVRFDNAALRFVENTSKTGFGKLFKKVRPYTFSVVEGLEEVSQYAAQTGSENYWTKKYLAGDEMDLDFWEGALALLGKGSSEELLGFGLQQAISDKGQEQFFIGGVSGAIGKARGNYLSQKRDAAQNRSLADLSNRYNVSRYTQATMDSISRGTVISQNMEDAVRQGDVLEYKDAERDFIINYLYPKIKYGRLDLVDDEIKAYEQIASTQEGFKRLQDEGKALPTDTREAYLSRLANLRRIADQVDLTYSTLNTRFGSQTRVNDEGQRVPRYSEEVLEKMVYSSSKIVDYDERIPLLSASLVAAGIDVNSVLDDNNKFQEAINQIEMLKVIGGKSITQDIKDELKRDLFDVVELSLRRSGFIEEYNDMMNNPEKYSEKTRNQTTNQTITTLRLKTRDGEEDLEIGVEYYLGGGTSQTEQGFLSEKYPIITILGQNEDGTIRIRDHQGNIRNIDPKELEPYKPGKVSDVKNNPKASFYMKHRNRIFEYKFKDGKKQGVLRWSPNENELYFEYKKDGKIRRIPVSNQDFSYKLAQSKGFKEPKIIMTNASLEDIQDADNIGDQKDTLANKLANRFSIITSLVTESRKRLNSIDRFIEDKQKQLNVVNESLENLQKTKKGIPRKKYTKTILKTLQELGETKSRLLNEINQLQDEKEELQIVLPYYEDLLQNYQELPDNTLELVDDLKSEISNLESLIEDVTETITTGNNLVQRYDSALQNAYKLLNDFIKRVREENPDVPLSLDDYQEKLEKFFGDQGAKEFIQNNEGYTPLIKSIQADISDFQEDLFIDINEEKISSLLGQIEDLQKGLKDLVEEQLAKSKILEFFEEKIQEEKNKKAEEEALLKNKQLQEQIFRSQKEAEALSGINNTLQSQQQINQELTKDQQDDTSRKKSVNILFSSTTSASETREPDSSVPPRIVRERNFLFNQTFFPPKVKQALRGIVVTINQQAQLKLNGLVESFVGNSGIDPKDVQESPILFVYTIERDSDFYYIDENGKEIGKVGDQIDINSIVASTLSTASTTWRDGTSRVRKGEEEQANQVASEWSKKRQEFFDSKNLQPFQFSVSRGIPIYNEVNGTYIMSSPSGTLFPESKKDQIANHQGAVRVITTDLYTHNEITYNTQPGRVYLEYEDIFAPLVNRQFTDIEADTLYSVLSELALQAKKGQGLKGDYLNFLQNVLFWGTPKGKPGRNQIWIDQDFNLNFGNNSQKIPFTPLSLEANKQILLAYLKGTYNNVNNHTLSNRFFEPFIEFYIENGKLLSVEHKNYQTYLLDNLETPIMPTKNIVENNGRNFEQKYSILQGLDFVVRQPTPAPTQTQQAPSTEQIATTSKGEQIYFTGSVDADGNANVSIITEKGDYKKALDRLMQAGIPEDQANEMIINTAVKHLASAKEKTAQYKVGDQVIYKGVIYNIKELSKTFDERVTYHLEDINGKPLLEGGVRKFVSLSDLSPLETGINLPTLPNIPTDQSAPDLTAGLFRQANDFSVERMSKEEKVEFEKFIAQNLPQFIVREVEHLIQMTGNKKAWGQLQGNVITLYKNAEKGTGYHEAFEAIWKYFVLPEEQDSLLNEFKNRQGTFNDRTTNTVVSYNEASDLQAKEELADEFARYREGKKLTLGNLIKRFFNRIINFFRSFNKGYKPNTELRDKLFDKISQGSFKNHKLPDTLSQTPEYSSVRGLTEAQTNAFVQDMTKRIFVELLREGVDLFEPEVYDRKDVIERLRAIYATPSKKDGKSSIDRMPAGEETFNSLVNRTKEYLRTFQIVFDENNNVTINSEEINKNDYVNDKMTLDVKKTSPFAVKYILASLAKTTGTDQVGNVTYSPSSISGFSLLPFAKTFVNLLETFEGAISLDDMINKLRKLSKENTDFIPLINMLGRRGGESLDWNNLTVPQWRMLAGFYNTFNKQRPETQFLTYSENGEVYFSNAEIGRSSEQIKDKWESNIRFNARNNKNIFLGYDRSIKLYRVDEAKVAEYKRISATLTGKLTFLSELGVDFPRNVYDRLKSSEDRDRFSNSVNSILNYISSKKGVKIVSSEAIGISGPLTRLAELYAKSNSPQSESTFLNGEGEQQQVFVQHNFLSQFTNNFNSVWSKEELFTRMPYLRTDVFARNSELLKNGGKFFDDQGNRTSTKLTLGYTDAVKTERGGKKIDNLEYPERISAQINNTLDGKYYISVPADSATEWYLNLPEFIDFQTSMSDARFNEKMQDIFIGYLQDEIEVAKEDRKLANIGKKGKDLRFFKNILSENNLRKANDAIRNGTELNITQSLKDDISKYIQSEVENLGKTLKYNQNLIYTGEETLAFSSLLDSFAKKNNINKESLTEDEAEALLRHVIANNLIANMELHKVFFGDPYVFAVKEKGGKVNLDETKRIKSFGSPAQPTLVSLNYNNTFNREFNTIGNTVLTPDIPGYYQVRDTVNTLTYSDIEIASQYVEDFTNVNEADAQALHTIQMHRDLLNRHGQWSKKAEEWYKWEMAYTRQALYKKGVFKNYPENLKINDEARLKKEKPEFYLHVIKPIVRGIKSDATFIDPILDKFSSAPLFYSAIEGTNLEDLYIKMFKENIDYVIFESGRKVGITSKNNFYTENGKFNKDPFTGKITVRWNDYSVQVENAYDQGKKQIRGSQITKLFSQDFMSGGVPIDYETDKAERVPWNQLSEEVKEVSSPVYKEIKWNNTLLNEMTKNGYNDLLNKLGIIDTGTNFQIVDYEKLYGILNSEATKRDMPENVKKIFKINPETKQPYLPLEASSEYTRIQKMLYSLVDKSIVSPKVNGGPKVQLSVVGWENKDKGRKLAIKSEKGYKAITEEEYKGLSDEDKKKVRLTSETLKFYTKDGPYMEILLPHWFKDKFKKTGFKSDLQLLEYLNNSEEGKEILRGVGFRIPTQGMSAIETFKVKGFLPQEFGDTVVVPSEITTKAGSDFDIDKLQMYLKNVYLDSKNKIKLVPFYGFGEEAKNKFRELIKNDNLMKVFDLSDTEALNEEELVYDEKEAQRDFKDIETQVERFYKESLENEYFRSLERMITNPLNYERLVQPTENSTLPNLANKIASLTNTTESNALTRLLSIDYLSKLRHAFLMGKKWVGIGAVNITGHSQAQRTNLYIDVQSTQLSQKDKEILGDGKVNLPHNIDDQGRPTLSATKDKSNKFISDKLSWYITAFVDVAKDPYILNIVPSRKLVGTFLFLERLGIPTETVAMFMNQPIIREYVHYSDIQGFSRLANMYWVNQFLSNSNFGNREAVELDLKKLESNIDDFYHGKSIDNTQQVLALKEFLKYYKMAEYLFTFNQSTNWDTTRFTTGATVRKKQIRLQNERVSNIIKSPDSILEISNNGKIREAVVLAKEAIETASKLTSPEIRKELNIILDRYLKVGYISEKALEKIDSQILNSFVDYLVQTKKYGNIESLILNAETSVISQVKTIQSNVALRQAYQGNPIFDYLKIQVSRNEGGADNIKITPFPKEVYEKNLISSSLQELKEVDSQNGQIGKNSLYGNLIKLALLQGTGNVSNLFSYIPLEDTANILQDVIGSVTSEDARNYAKNFNFERVNWKNTDIVPEFGPIIAAKYQFPTEFGPKVLRISDVYNSSQTEYPVLRLQRYNKLRKSVQRYDLVSGNIVNFDTIKDMIEKKDFSFVDVVGYQKVFLPNGEPFTQTITDDRGTVHTYHYYKQVNLTGTGEIQEHYTGPQKSVINNSTVKFDQVLSDEEIVNKLTNIQAPPKSDNNLFQSNFETFKNSLKSKDC